ncbi:hypothetical protein IFM89_032977 [Coptis chinensis]|uniref:glycine--tRNA ligase n=1 Tax=Coptis chinensis TaxID=261450 RepID=A0A835HQY8_9MAGN|nr:hypothetical protein IFM89_032977 [Coptis chinensis]
MAMLTFPLALTLLKPHAPHFSFICCSKTTTNRTTNYLYNSFHHYRRSSSSYSKLRNIRNTRGICSNTCSAISESETKVTIPTFQQAIQRLQEYWASVGCTIMQCSNTEVGAGTMNPLTFLRVMGPEPWNVAYVEPSIRPDDSRYGENPNRLQRHTQFQVSMSTNMIYDLWRTTGKVLSHWHRFLVHGGWAGRYGWMEWRSHNSPIFSSLARQCAQLWVKTRESLGHPLGISYEPNHLVSKEVTRPATREGSEVPRLFVLEVGTEEMPPQDVISASQQVLVEGLFSKQTENETEVRGPPVAKAFDLEGNPTKAAEGFCRKYNTSMDSMFKKVDGKTEYVYLHVKESVQLALEVLAEDLPATIGKISFPKSMRWNSEVMFTRPIRWVLALHGDVVVPFTFAGVLSGNMSCGLRNTPSATIKVEHAEDYVRVMEKVGISINIEDRKKNILDASNSLAKSVGGHLVNHSTLIEEVVNLVESPIPILGEFNESFLELPEDLLIMVMQKHQKYFSIRDDDGRLLPYFIAVANGMINPTVVRKGNEAVLRARYEDAKFFYEMDLRKNFYDFRSHLKGVLFHEKLGTMLDKMTRVQNTVTKLSLAFGLNKDQLQVVQGAAMLAMADLSTAVVTEFTSLSGIMARHYALKDGYSEQIAEALFEIMLPRFSGDILPKTDPGIVLAIADRLDTLVGLFGVGCQPTSTNDPLGLRRISYGLVQILVENDKNLDIRSSLEVAAEVQPIQVDHTVVDNVHQFVTRRLEQYLVDKGISPEVVRSILLERSNFPCLATKSAIKMEALSRGELFPKVVEAYSRPTRIIRGKSLNANVEVSEAVFETCEERDLWSAFLEVKNKVHPGIEVDDFVEASSQLLQPLDSFFNHVFVMVEDERVRMNRLALLKNIADLPKGIADLSVLPGF